MKFEDDDLKDGKLWAALQKEIDRDLAEKESGETFQEELADIEDSIEFESKETKSEDHIPDETANLSNLRSVLEATERAKDEEAKQKMKQTKVEPVTQDIEIPEFTEEEEEIEETPAETKTESEPEEVMVDDDLIINDPFADEDDLLGEEKTETKGSEKEVLGDQVEAAMERLVSDTVGRTAGRDASEMMELLFWLDEFNPSALHLFLPRKFPGEKCNEVADTSVYYHDNDS